jgi:hypothetical protein
MKQFCLIVFGFFFGTIAVHANNLVIGTTTYSSANQTLTFTVSWDNSWSISSGPSNWDAVWIFVKRQNCSGNNDWVHQLVSTTSADHAAQTGGATSSVVAVNATSDGMGVFVRRIGTNVVGNVATQTITCLLYTSDAADE